MKNVFEIKVIAADIPAKALMFIKSKTNASLSEAKSSVEKRAPIFGCGLSDDAGIVRIIKIREKLLEMGVQTEVLEDGETISIELLKNTLASHIDTAREMGLIDYLEEIQDN